MPLTITHILRFALVVFCAATLSACGGGSDITVPGATGATQLTGAIVKGPVSGATVCAYNASGGSKGSPLGSCTTSDPVGNYTLSVPLATGLVLVQATGGSYVDEATKVATALAETLSSVATVTGSNATAIVTPLTTLAVNAALAAGPLTAASFAAQSQSVSTAFGLPATLNLATSTPDFTNAVAEAYALALTNISRMVQAGTSLQTIVGTTDPSTLTAAYTQAAASAGGTTGSTPGTTPGTGTTAAPTATGTLNVTAGRAPTFTPQANGFTVQVNSSQVTYRFFEDRRVTQGSAIYTLGNYLEVTANALGVVTSATFNDPQVPNDITAAPAYCAGSNCGGAIVIETPSGATHPVTVRLSNARLTRLGGGTVTLDGSLTGDATGALWRVQDLPRTVDGAVGINGVNHAVLSGNYSVTTGSVTQQNVNLALADGTSIVLSAIGTAAPSVTYSAGVNTGLCVSGCPATLTTAGDGIVVNLNGTTLSNGKVLTNSIFVGRTTGTLTLSGFGTFAASSERLSTENSKITYYFSSYATTSTSAAPTVTGVSVTFENSIATNVEVSGNNLTAIYSCSPNTAALGISPCNGITLGTNRRTVTFNGTTVYGYPAAGGNITLNGTLVAKGL